MKRNNAKKKNTKGIWALVIVLAILILVLSYSLIVVLGNKSDEQVIAFVNGEKILKQQIMDIYEQEKIYYEIFDENDPEQKDIIKNLKTDILEQLIYERLVAQKAKEAGFLMDDEVLAEAGDDMNVIFEDVAEQMMEEDADENASDYMKEAQEYIDDELQAMGITRDEYIYAIAEQKLVERFFDEVTKDIEVTDEDIQNYYNAQIKIQKDTGVLSADNYVQLFSEAEVRVKHVLIEVPKDQQDEYDRIMLEENEETAKNYLEEKLKTIQPKAEEALNKARAGEDFEKLIEEYGQDPGMEENEDGYIVRHDGQYEQEFEDAAFNLKEGEISNLVATPFGYHIIKLYEKKSEKVFSLEEKQNEIKEVVTLQKKNELWNSLVEEWQKNADIKKYENLLSIY